ncbi:unnamed protein product [Caenorhabditis angaria]|uniref:G-protein coupled receptors family 1 profile domain-containing protein n=1 Tax=Caenorhabditis angaria TaxID=860376 RepID=A0A9P1J380_9PELO|nr:unnamed protein product [Caenorhabditis angaria]
MALSHQLCHILRNETNYSLIDFDSLLELEKLKNESTTASINRITYAYIAPFIIMVGIIGDILTVVTLTHPLLRKASIIYTYLTLLAMTDLLTQLSVLPMILWLLNVRVCSKASAFYYAHIGFPLANALMGASVWIVVFLTLSQYMAVCKPFAYGLRSRKICFILFALAYVFNFLIYAPWAAKKHVTDMSEFVPVRLHNDICPYVVCDLAVEPFWFSYYVIPRELLSRVFPFLIVAFLNTRILITYRKTKRDRMERLANSQKRFMYEKSEKEEKRLFMLLFGIVIIFFVCTIPAAPLTYLVEDSKSFIVSFQVFRAVVNILEFTKFALNFYFYCLINPDIRGICAHVIMCRKITRPPRVKGQPTTPISMYTRSTKNSTIRDNHKGSEKRRIGDESNQRDSVKRLDDSRNNSLKSGRDNTRKGVAADSLIEKLTVIKENESVTSETGDRV